MQEFTLSDFLNVLLICDFIYRISLMKIANLRKAWDGQASLIRLNVPLSVQELRNKSFVA